jgi:hypothetical protein
MTFQASRRNFGVIGRNGVSFTKAKSPVFRLNTGLFNERISGLYLKHITTAISYKKALLNGITSGNAESAESNPFGEDVKLVNEISQKQKYLTPTEKDEVVEKYADGSTMKALAEMYGCNRKTIRCLLVKRGVAIRR